MTTKNYEKGIRDGSNGNNHPPHGGLVGMFFSDSERADRRSYHLGYYYSKGQTDGAINDYSPPSSVVDNQKNEFRKAYDKGWENGRDSHR